MSHVFQSPIDGSQFTGQEADITCARSSREIQGDDGLLGMEEINQEAAQALKRVARVRDDDQVHPIQPPV